jgi:DNA primase catalytic subunit
MLKSSQEFKQMQRDRINQTKPWLNSTGAKTMQGKEMSKMNALKLNPKVNNIFKFSKELIRLQRCIHQKLSR